jgi:hypothetical protein
MASSAPQSHDSTREHDLPNLDGQFEIVKLDYERTLALLDGLSNRSMALRAAGVAGYLTLLSLGINQGSAAICLAAAALLSTFAYLDAYNRTLYDFGVTRANDLERLFQHRFRTLDRPYDEYPSNRLRVLLESYRFGVLGNLPRTGPRAVARHCTTRDFWPYASLAIAAVVAAPLA